jgi:RNA polymerase sigma-70 factor, ECF subfamily
MKLDWTFTNAPKEHKILSQYFAPFGVGSDAMSSENQVTELLLAWNNGDEMAFQKLVPLVYDELRRRARQYMLSQPAGHTLQPTALVHEAFLKLVGQKTSWNSRTHFMAVAAIAMRRVLIDHARHKNSRGRGELISVPQDEAALACVNSIDDMVELELALGRLEQNAPHEARVFELRYFGGLTIEEVSEVMKIGVATVSRYWEFAKTWLIRELRKGERH